MEYIIDDTRSIIWWPPCLASSRRRSTIKRISSTPSRNMSHIIFIVIISFISPSICEVLPSTPSFPSSSTLAPDIVPSTTSFEFMRLKDPKVDKSGDNIHSVPYKTLGKPALIEPLDASDSSVVLKWPLPNQPYFGQRLDSVGQKQFSVARDVYSENVNGENRNVVNNMDANMDAMTSVPMASFPNDVNPFNNIPGDSVYNPYQMLPSQINEQINNQMLASNMDANFPYQSAPSYQPSSSSYDPSYGSKANIAPYPPHRDYLPVPGYDPKVQDANSDAEEDVVETLKKKKKKLRIKPVNHEFFKSSGKHKATLPYKPTEPFLELSRAINDVRKAVLKIKPMKRLANQAFNQFTIGVKARIKNMRGPYGYSYPTGYYDFR